MLSVKNDSDRLRFILLGILCTGFICVIIALSIQLGKASKTEEIPIEQLLQQYWQEQLAAQPANEVMEDQLTKELPAPITQAEPNAGAAHGQTGEALAIEDQAAKADAAQEGQVDQGGASEPISEAATEQEGKIDINRATAEQLQQLKGIGPSKASAIVEDRERKGSFKSIQDIKRVKGIGEKLFAGIQDSIVANP